MGMYIGRGAIIVSTWGAAGVLMQNITHLDLAHPSIVMWVEGKGGGVR
jgi:hypothetical protein